MNYILFDDKRWEDLLPLTYTRPVCELRIGILTIREKWNSFLDKEASYKTQEYLDVKYPTVLSDDNVFINGGIFPSRSLLVAIASLKENEALVKDSLLIAVRLNKAKAINWNGEMSGFPTIKTNEDVNGIEYPWDIFKKNGEAIKEDFELLTKGRKSAPISSTNTVLGEQLFVEKGAKIECAILNTTTGPIYIGKESEIMEGSVVRGPFALCEGSGLKLSTKIYGPTTVGPHSKVGGEVNNSVIIGYSNKGHDGFLGNSVLGEWCNLGADTNNSNLKNNYAEVDLWSYRENGYKNTGLQFCGLIMGDHSKSGINTMFNTGTVVGVNANIYGGGFQSKFIPSFSWGEGKRLYPYKIEKAIEVAERVMERRGKTLDEIERKILTHIFEVSQKYHK